MEINYSTYFWQNNLVRLRPVTADDWNTFYLNYFDSPARFFLNSVVELPLTEDGAKEAWNDFIENSKKVGLLTFTIDALDGHKIGGINLGKIDERNGTFSIGIQIGRDFRGKGYGTAAMKILLDYAFNERQLHKYQGFVIEGNIPSEKMLIKLGCVKEGVIRGTTYHEGKYWNEIHYGLFADEFNALHGK